LPRPRGLTQKDKRKLQKFVTKAMRFYDLTRADVALGEFYRQSKSIVQEPKADKDYRLSVVYRLFTDHDNLSGGIAHGIGIMLLSCPKADAWRKARNLPRFADWRAIEAGQPHDFDFHNYSSDDLILKAVTDEPMSWWDNMVDDVFPSLQCFNVASSDTVYFPPMLLPSASINRCAQWIEHEHESRKQGRKRIIAKSTFAERLAREVNGSAIVMANVLSDQIAMRLVGLNLPNRNYLLPKLEHPKDSAGKEILPDLYRKYNDIRNLVHKTILDFQKGSES